MYMMMTAINLFINPSLKEEALIFFYVFLGNKTTVNITDSCHSL